MLTCVNNTENRKDRVNINTVNSLKQSEKICAFEEMQVKKVNNYEIYSIDHEPNKRILNFDEFFQMHQIKEDHNFFHEVKSTVSQFKLLFESKKQALSNKIIKYEELSTRCGCARNYEHVIKLKTKKPFIKLGIIEHSIRTYCNPLRIVKRKDRKVLMPVC